MALAKEKVLYKEPEGQMPLTELPVPRMNFLDCDGAL